MVNAGRDHNKIERSFQGNGRAAQGVAQDKDLRARRETAPGGIHREPATSISSGCCRERDLLKGESLYDIENVTVVHHANQALKAHTLFQRDRDYIVKAVRSSSSTNSPAA